MGNLHPAKSSRLSLSICLLSVIATATPLQAEQTPPDESRSVSYYQDIRPLFQAKCQGCHQPAKKLGDYLMTSFDALLAGGESGEAAIVPGDPDASYLVGQITVVDGQAEMPQRGKPFADHEVELIRQWISQGAVNDTPTNASVVYSSENPPIYTRPPVINSLDYSPDGKWLAVSGFHEVLFYEVDGSYEQPIARFVGMSPRIESVRFSPDSKRLAVVGGRAAIAGEVQIWDVASGQLELSIPVGYDTIYGASWSPDGARLAFGCGDSTVRVVDVQSGEQVLYQRAHNDWVFDTAFSKDGSHLVSVGRDMTAKLIEVATQRFVDNITSITPKALKGGIQSVVRHPLKDHILLGGADGVPKIYQMHRTTARQIGDDANLKWELPALPGRIFGVDFSTDASRIAAGSSLNGQGAVHIYGIAPDYQVPKEINAILVKPTHTRSAEELKKLAQYFEEGVAVLAQLDFATPIYAVAFNPAGSHVAAAGGDGQVRIINAADGQMVHSFLPVKLSQTDVDTRSHAVPSYQSAGVTLEPKPLPEGIQVASLHCEAEEIRLAGTNAYHQIFVTATTASGEQWDVTRLATLSVQGEVADVTSTGLVSPRMDGEGQLVATLGEHHAAANLHVAGLTETSPPDYVRDVMPVVSRLGCNAGTCHGSKDGKNGFKLSLRGYDPIYDIRAFTDDVGSRRVNVAAPDNSLILQKATAAVPHEGGQLTQPDSQYYQILREWIADGAKLHLDTPRVTQIEVSPKNPVVQSLDSRQQMRVTATYADGVSRDVTREAFISSGNTDVAVPVDGRAGLIQVKRRGEAPLLVRFEGTYAATTVTVMGNRDGFAWREPPSNGPIDDFVSAKLKRTKTSPAPLCNDYEFVRRVYLDLTGLPPTPQVIREFVDDPRDSRWKRDELIDRLIGSPAYVDHWSNKWSDLLQVNSKFLGSEGAKLFREWIHDRVQENMPYDKFVRAILTAKGSNYDNPAASYFKILRTPEDTMENTTHLFLATRFNCNKCHDHPFERWTQDQYYEMSAFFAQVGLKKDDRSGDKTIGRTAVESGKPLYEEVFDRDSGEVKHERTGEVTAPQTPYPATNAFALKEQASRRERLVAWMTSPDNQYFAKSYVNRLWGYLTGTGIIEPIDDIRAGNPPTNPELLNYLTQRLVDEAFDSQAIIREICKSRTYQLSVASDAWNEDDAVNYSHAKARRLPAEVLYDAIQTVTGSQSAFPNVPKGTRASALPDVGIKLPDGFLGNLGRPARESACECERSNDVQLGSVMALVSGPTVGEALAGKENALVELVQQHEEDDSLFNEIFLRILNRPATPDEIDASKASMAAIETEHQELQAQLAQAERDWKPIEADLQVKRWQNIALAERELNQYLASTKEQREQAVRDREARMEAATSALAKYESQFDSHFQAWESSSNRATNWQVLDFDSTRSTFGAEFHPMEDGSIFVDGKHGRGNYDLEASTELTRITGLRIEALQDERLPKNGPGRADDGNFVLSELKLRWSDGLVNSESEVRKWTKESGLADWSASSEAKWTAADDGYQLVSSGSDPQLATEVAADGQLFLLEMQAKLSGTAESQLFWSTTEQAQFSEDRSVRLTLSGQDRWLPYRYYFHAGSGLRSLRLDPLTKSGSLQIRELRLLRIDGPSFQERKLVDAQADFSQNGYDVGEAIDGKNAEEGDGWAISPQAGKSHQAIFALLEPLESTLPQRLQLTLMQNYRGNIFSLGRFRVSVTSSTAPLDFGLPESIQQILALAVENRNDEQKTALQAYFRQSDRKLKELNDALAAAKKPLPEDPERKKREAKIAMAKQPIPISPSLLRLRSYVEASEVQLANKRLTAAQDVAWALINSPAFLFNH